MRLIRDFTAKPHNRIGNKMHRWEKKGEEDQE